MLQYTFTIQIAWVYSYCGNNPVVRIDPSGMVWQEWVAKALFTWIFGAACKGVEVYNDGGNFLQGFFDGLFFNPSVSVSGSFDSNGIYSGERPDTTVN